MQLLCRDHLLTIKVILSQAHQFTGFYKKNKNKSSVLLHTVDRVCGVGREKRLASETYLLKLDIPLVVLQNQRDLCIMTLSLIFEKLMSGLTIRIVSYLVNGRTILCKIPESVAVMLGSQHFSFLGVYFCVCVYEEL